MLGITKYQPTFYGDIQAFRRAHGDRLRRLVGGTIQNSWAVWSGVDDRWFPDGPVIIEIGGDRIEFAAYQLGFAVTWNVIDLRAGIRWCIGEDEDDGLSLSWKERSPEPLQRAVDRRVEQVELSECLSTIREQKEWLVNGVVMRLDRGFLAIFNSLDELGLSSERFEADYIRYTAL